MIMGVAYSFPYRFFLSSPKHISNGTKYQICYEKKRKRKKMRQQILVIGHSCIFFIPNQLFSCFTEITCTTVGYPVFLFVVIFLFFLKNKMCVPHHIDMIYNTIYCNITYYNEAENSEITTGCKIN